MPRSTITILAVFGRLFDGCGCGGDLVLLQARAIVPDVDRQRLRRGLLVPRHEVSPGDLIGGAALAGKADFDFVRRPRIDFLENELMEQVVIFRGELEPAGDFPFRSTSTAPFAVAPPFSIESSSARNAMMVACVVPQVPAASLLATM